MNRIVSNRGAQFAAALTLLLAGAVTEAAVVYDESAPGAQDLSDNRLAPTALALSVGSNVIAGTMGFLPDKFDLDYFTVTVPTGTALTQLVLLPGTQVAIGVSFLGMQAGTSMTVPADATSAAGLTGWTHYTDPAPGGTDILPAMSVPTFGSSGFAIPLGAGNYTFWVQDFDDAASYRFDFVVAQTAPVPVPGALAMMLPAVAALGAARRRRAGREQ